MDDNFPYLSADLPGIGGRLRTEPEDFQVWELPAYEPTGEGEHRFVELTKRGDTTPYAIGRLARELGIGADEIGYAGMKDRHAVTTQRLSLPAAAGLPSGVRELGLHPHKLRRGHLAGNRFQIRVRDAVPGALARAQAIAGRLRSTGWANAYGPQRFGHEKTDLRARMPGWKRSLLVSARQSELFNLWLRQRLEGGDFARIVPGDLCAKLPAGGMFVGWPETEQPRLEAFEISPTGPIYGFKMRQAEGEEGEREAALLAEAGLTLADFKAWKAPGSRRRMRLPLPALELREDELGLVFGFELPAGSYATVLLREFMKDVELGEELSDE